MNAEARTEFITALETLKKDGPTDKNKGICFNLNTLIFGDDCVAKKNRGILGYDGYCLVAEYSARWRFTTGCPDLPVPGDYLSKLWEGDKGAFRYDLIDFMLMELRNEEFEQGQKMPFKKGGC